MGVIDFVKKGVREMMIARPDQFKHLVVYKHPDQNFPAWSQLTIDSDECAVFFKDGRVVGVLPPGRHTLSTQNIPFLNNIVNRFTGGDVFISEIYFVKTAPVRSLPFGGPIGDMIDPLTGEQVTPRIFGEMSLVVTDPVRFIVGYTGQAAQGDNDAILGWIKGLFMNGVKTTLGELCEVEQKSLLQAVSLTTKLAHAFVANAPELNDVGVRILQMGQFTLNFSDEDRQRLVAANAEIAKANRGVKVAEAAAKARQFELDQKYSQDARYVQNLAGNYQNYAAGQAMMGAGQGMAAHGVEGGVAGAGVQMALGVSMANQMAAAMQSQAAPQPQFTPGGAMVLCPKCGSRQPAGKFCAECGTALAQPKKFCAGCGQEMAASAKFCANCGTSVAAERP
ncbi:MAG: SPFH domain-containing protein [Polyangiaceae bacterium]|nr:SPFH domain-containing protein [Polyangiaceae bacterium]